MRPARGEWAGEFFRFGDTVWDIAKAEKLVAGRSPNWSVRPADAKVYWEQGWVDVDPDHASTADLSRPVIGIPSNVEGSHFIIDGWHRLYRAYAEDVSSLPAHLLTREEEMSVRVRQESFRKWDRVRDRRGGRLGVVTGTDRGLVLVAWDDEWDTRHDPSRNAGGYEGIWGDSAELPEDLEQVPDDTPVDLDALLAHFGEAKLRQEFALTNVAAPQMGLHKVRLDAGLLHEGPEGRLLTIHAMGPVPDADDLEPGFHPDEFVGPEEMVGELRFIQLPDDTIYLVKIWVHHFYRQHGLATAMYNAVYDSPSRNGAPIYTNNTTSDGARFVASLGSRAPQVKDTPEWNDAADRLWGSLWRDFFGFRESGAFQISHVVYGTVSGEDFGAVLATESGRTVGQIRYSVWGREVLVTWVWVEPERRRQGVASAMLAHLQSAYPGHDFVANDATDDGAAWLRGIGSPFRQTGLYADRVPVGIGTEPSLRLLRGEAITGRAARAKATGKLYYAKPGETHNSAFDAALSDPEFRKSLPGPEGVPWRMWDAEVLDALEDGYITDAGEFLDKMDAVTFHTADLAAFYRQDGDWLPALGDRSAHTGEHVRRSAQEQAPVFDEVPRKGIPLPSEVRASLAEESVELPGGYGGPPCETCDRTCPNLVEKDTGLCYTFRECQIGWKVFVGREVRSAPVNDPRYTGDFESVRRVVGEILTQPEETTLSAYLLDLRRAKLAEAEVVSRLVDFLIRELAED